MIPERFVPIYIETGGLQMCASTLTFSKIGTSVIREAMHNPSKRKKRKPIIDKTSITNYTATTLLLCIFIMFRMPRYSILCVKIEVLVLLKSICTGCWCQTLKSIFFLTVVGKRARVGVFLLSKPNLVVGSALVKYSI